MRRYLLYLLIPAFTLTAGSARAQCPDGSPPPCASPSARRAPPPAAVRARHFLLLSFRNVTRKPEQEWLTTGAPLMLAQILGQFRDLEVVPEERVAAARRKVGVTSDATADASQLRKLADETGGWTAVTGNVFATGNRLRIATQAMDVVTSRVLVRAETEIPADADPREAFDRLSVRLLEPTGVPASAPSLAALTTSSVDAFRAYVRGAELYQLARFREAEKEFTDAVRLDSSFALAWSALAAASVSSAGVAAIMNPASAPYRAAEQAARLASRLPPRKSQFVRGISAVFHGEIRRGRRLLDSLLTADPNDLDVAYWVAMLQFMAPPADTSVRPARLESSPNRAVALAKMILEQDPRRRIVYQIPVVLYGLGGGLLWGDIYGFRRDFPSFGAAMAAVPDVREVPVLEGEAIKLVARATFDSLPPAERRRLRRLSADAAWDWTQRWLLAGAEDAEAHAYAARIAELREDYDRALLELHIADSLGIQASIENVPGWKLSLLLLSGRANAAAAMADSMLTVGTLTNAPFIRMFDRRRAYGTAALLLAKRWDRAATMAEMMGAPRTQTACASLRREMAGFADAVLPERLRRAVMDTVSAHLPEVAANPTLAPCADVLSKGLYP